MQEYFIFNFNLPIILYPFIHSVSRRYFDKKYVYCRLSYVDISSLPAYSIFYCPLSENGKGRSATDWNIYSKGWVRADCDSSRVPMKYTFSASKWIRKLIFDGHPARWFGLVFQFSARRCRRRRCRDVIVKYDYSVSRRLFLTPDSPLLHSRLYSQPSGDRRTIDRAQYRTKAIQSHRLSSNDIAQSGELIEISGARSFSTMRFSLAADCFRNFPRVSRTLVNIPFLRSTTNVTFRTQRAVFANPIELELIHFCPLFYLFTYGISLYSIN